jgi:hypothetical protein
LPADRTPPPAPPRPFATPDASPLRRALERRSAVLLVFLRRLPRAVLPVTVAALVAGFLLGPPAVAIACLSVVIAFFGWLLFLSWPAISPGARLLRLVVLLVMVAGVVQQALAA